MKTCPTCQASYPNNFQVCPQDGESLVESGAWSEGAVIRGKYRILSKVGQGGMGAVYKVVHVAFDEVHALKVINPALMSDELFVKRFKHEAVITRKLRHPNAVRVDDIDEAEDGRPIIVMEYIEGQSLKKLIQEEGALPPPRVCAIIKQAAAALDAAHQLGMVHRDIKPDNIVLVSGPQGEQVKVLDFGIAKVKEAGVEAAGMTLTGTGVVIGTPQYMSPEQAMGKRGDELDGRSDIYSLGVVMYQMLSGDLPFKADTTMGMLLAHMQTLPTPILSLHPELQIPNPIARVVMRTLEKDPGHRPQSALALITEIEEAEKSRSPMNETRVVEPTSVYSPHDTARALRDSLRAAEEGATRRAGPRAAPPQRPAPTTPPMSPSSAAGRSQPVAPRVEPAVSPRPAVVAPPRPVPAPPARQKSNAGLWATIAVLFVLLVGTGLYFVGQNMNRARDASSSPGDQPAASGATDKGASSTPETSSTPSGAAKSNPGESQATSPGASVPTTDLRSSGQTRGQKKSASVGRGKTDRPNRPSERELARGTPKPAVDESQINGNIKLGDFYYDHGEYDNAVAEYSRGLKLDPSNSTLRARIDRAQKAKAAESRVLQ